MPIPTPTDRSTGDPLITRATANTAIVNLALANPQRTYFNVFNEPGGAIMYVKHGAGCSTTSYTVQILAGGYWEMQINPRTGRPVFDGVVTAVWASASGAAQVTEGGA